MARTKAVLFDLDGTLRDTRETVYRALEETVGQYGGRVPSRQEIQKHVHHHSAVHAALSPDVEYELWLATYREKLGSEWMDAPFFTHAEKVLQQLVMSGHRLAVVTAADYDRTVEYLSYRRIDHFFEVVTGLRPGLLPKPEPDLMLDALRQLDCAPSEAVTVGDMPTDLRAAEAAGVRFIGVSHGFGSRAELEAAGATIIIDSLEELLAIVDAD